ncbi:MAG: orotate phosphoribosyltransferase [Candidatus Diapherotrites archaeon]|nr:orotate phosphoribosyltransferase [Candidatus Diapherotrites archaeon]
MSDLENLCLKLNEIGAIKFGDFTLKSGLKSPIYIDLRVLVSFPLVLKMTAQEMAIQAKSLQYDSLCGIPYTALPIATLLSQELNKPLIYARKETKDYGTKRKIEGVFKEGQTILVIDDLITDGGSKFETIQPLEEAGLKIKDILVLVDREQGGAKTLKEKGYNLHAVIGIKHLLSVLNKHGKLSDEKVKEILDYLEKKN